mmetsp:Transcript_8984/g.19477  ORF Transcript_8984/g.19477 Transcript_8984/m.19477 type:complete len:324 (-) Transcript_8984:575-1546(-)
MLECLRVVDARAFLARDRAEAAPAPREERRGEDERAASHKAEETRNLLHAGEEVHPEESAHSGTRSHAQPSHREQQLEPSDPVALVVEGELQHSLGRVDGRDELIDLVGERLQPRLVHVEQRLDHPLVSGDGLLPGVGDGLCAHRRVADAAARIVLVARRNRRRLNRRLLRRRQSAEVELRETHLCDGVVLLLENLLEHRRQPLRLGLQRAERDLHGQQIRQRHASSIVRLPRIRQLRQSARHHRRQPSKRLLDEHERELEQAVQRAHLERLKRRTRQREALLNLRAQRRHLVSIAAEQRQPVVLQDPFQHAEVEQDEAFSHS